MYCEKCGSEMNQEAKFCFSCGEKNKIKTEKEVIISDNNEKETFDRTVIIGYLKNVLTLYCMSLECDKDRKTIEREIEYWEPLEKEKIDLEEKMKRKEKAKRNAWKEIKKYGALGVVVFTILLVPAFLIDLIETIWYAICDFFNPSSRKRKEELDREEKESWEKVKDSSEMILALQKEKNDLENKEIEIKKQIQNFYSLNIIPKPYRNVQAVCFLYEFMETSNESFSSAMYHCDLDEIKNKMDISIRNQSEIIINQAKELSQNQTMIEQNYAKLRTLANVMIGTDMGDRYNQLQNCYVDYYSWLGSY